MDPEEEARVEIDRQLILAGWEIQDYKNLFLKKGVGVAVREFPMKKGHGFADYLLFVGLEAYGVVEAKPVGWTLTGVETQTKKYSKGLPDGLRCGFSDNELKFLYESTGIETRFTNVLDPEPKSRRVSMFHRPDTLACMFNEMSADKEFSMIEKIRDNLGPLDIAKLWPAQAIAVRNLEESILYGRRRHLIQMATGSGKTYTAITSISRMISSGGVNRVLFIVDRGNLGRQAKREFDQYHVAGTGKKFSEIWNVQLLETNQIDPVARVVISTVQRLYSILRGEQDLGGDEELSLATLEGLRSPPPPITYTPSLPIEFFDVLIIDECHRSVYNLWRQVIEYFDSHLIGLTATPSAQAIGFFSNNLVMEYGHRHAVADGVNVDYNVFRIRTNITENGEEIESGMIVDKRDVATRAIRWEKLDADLDYDPNTLDKSVVSKSQLNLILRTWRDHLPVMFPSRTHVPKTLIFAKSDSHADDIVQEVREVFGKGNDFCRKLTYKTTGIKPDDLLASFRNSYNPRVVVTVDMIATGTDVKAIEALLFMRMVRSRNFFQQMKGRGVRVIDQNALASVSPDASEGKEKFWIIDAIGVTEEHAQNDSPPLDRAPTVSFERLIKAIAAGSVDADIHLTLAGRLARLRNRIDSAKLDEFSRLAGKNLQDIINDMVDAQDSDLVIQSLKHELPNHEFSETVIEEKRLDLMDEAVAELRNPLVRDWLLNVGKLLEQTMDMISQDFILSATISKEAEARCKSVATSFEQWIDENKDSQIALQILYDRPKNQMPNYAQIRDLHEKLTNSFSQKFPQIVWQAYSTLSEKGGSHKPIVGGNKLSDLVQLIKHVIDPGQEPLMPYSDIVVDRFHHWMNDQESAGLIFDVEQKRWLEDIANHIAGSLEFTLEDLEYPPFSSNGGLMKFHEVFQGDYTIIETMEGELIK